MNQDNPTLYNNQQKQQQRNTVLEIVFLDWCHFTVAQFQSSIKLLTPSKEYSLIPFLFPSVRKRKQGLFHFKSSLWTWYEW